MFSLITGVLYRSGRQILYQNDPQDMGRLLRVSTVVKNTAFASNKGISNDASNKTAESDVFKLFLRRIWAAFCRKFDEMWFDLNYVFFHDTSELSGIILYLLDRHSISKIAFFEFCLISLLISFLALKYFAILTWVLWTWSDRLVQFLSLRTEFGIFCSFGMVFILVHSCPFVFSNSF